MGGPSTSGGAGFVPTPVYAADALRPGHRLAGPAVVEAEDTTALIHPGQAAHVDAFGNLIIALAA